MKFIKDYPIKDLIPNENNPRKNDIAAEKLQPLIEKFGFINPIIIDQDKIIRAGHTRLKTARKMGVETVPVIEIKFKTKADALAYSIADNKSAEFAEWDFDFLKSDFEELAKDSFDMELTGFNPDEIDELMGTGKEVEEDDFDVDKVMKEPKYNVNVGDVWTLGKHRLVCGDSTKEEDVKLLMDGKKADMVFTDPPYGIDYQSNMRTKSPKFDVIQNDDKIITEWIQLALEYSTGWFLFCTTWKVLPQWFMISEKIGKLTNMIIWNKGGGGIGDLSHSLLTDYEIIFAYNRGNELKGKRIGSVWDIGKDNPSTYKHPTQKPIKLASLAINILSKGSILDLFGGSGSTLIACEQTDRICYMMELDPIYISVIIERWETLTGKQAIRVVKGKKQ